MGTRTDTDAIGNQTFYTIFVRWPDEVRLFTGEHTMLETVDDVLAEIDQLSNGAKVAAIFRHDYDVPRQDVTEEVAELAMRRWEAEGNVEGRDPMPDFIDTFAPSHIATPYGEITIRSAAR
jgi:hypothetical protein